MAVDFHLVPRQPASPDDAMGRTWYGWDPSASDEELWEINRGTWRLRDGAPDERFATLSADGHIQIVAEITGRERYGDLWALTGVVLQPGDPVRDGLVGLPVRQQRNPVSYLDTSEQDLMGTADRARFERHDRVTVLVTWDPARWHWYNREEMVAITATGGIVRGSWVADVEKGEVRPGDRVFLLKQGNEPRGLVGSGTCSSHVLRRQLTDDGPTSADTNYILVDWDAALDNHNVLRLQELTARIPAGGSWRPQRGGALLTPDVAHALEVVWAEHLQHPEVGPPPTSAGQGWQLDKERRKKVEDAAQARLTQHFRDDHWQVKDVRFRNSYDAIAIKGGQILYLEAKGTETPGASVIVSRGEVNWARQHPGRCKLGVLSDVRFLPDGEVDETSGSFNVHDWNPEDGNLVPRDFDWTPPPSD